ncbi:type VI secretion system baseplate subunit TssK [Klebsiella variicola subsp. variicola]|nr:type VI secretion system baseplate subunit TssK [Klebsiella variicola subsp. variicola]
MMMSPRSSTLPLSGIAIKPLEPRAAAIPLRLENQYFALDLPPMPPARCWRPGNCTFYTPESLGDVKLELFAVLRL